MFMQVLVQSIVHSFDGSCLETLLVEEDLTGRHVLEMFHADAEAFDVADAGFVILPKDVPLHEYAGRISHLHITKAQEVQTEVQIPTLATTEAVKFHIAVQANLGHVRAELDARMQQYENVAASLSADLASTSLVLLWDQGSASCQQADEATASATPILDLLSAEPVLMEDTMGTALKLKLVSQNSLCMLELLEGGTGVASQQLHEQRRFWVMPRSSIEGLRKQLMVLRRIFAAGLLQDSNGSVLDFEECLEDAVDIIPHSMDSPQVGCSLCLASCVDPVEMRLQVGTSSPEDDAQHHHARLVLSLQDIWGFPELGVPFWGLHNNRIIVYWGLSWGSPILGNCRFRGQATAVVHAHSKMVMNCPFLARTPSMSWYAPHAGSWTAGRLLR